MGSNSKASPMTATTSSTSSMSDDPPSVELRASVLDAAISLGFRNSVMAKWMFDPNSNAGEAGTSPSERSNPGLLSPTATSASSHSVTNSDESSMSPYIGRFRPSHQSPDRSKHGALGVINEQNIEYTTSTSLEKLPPYTTLVRIGNAGDVDPFNPLHDPFKKDDPDANAYKTSYESSAKESRHRKQKGSGGYDSDGGYLSEGGTGKKPKSKSLWGRKGSENTNGNAHDVDESDGGYLSEAVATKGRGKSSKKEKARGKREDAMQRTTDLISSNNGNPDAFLAKINASLDHSTSPATSPSTPDANINLPSTSTSSSSISAHHGKPDGYTTDSGSSKSRGRSRSAPSKKAKKGQPLAVWDDQDQDKMPAPTQKKSFFRIVSRSISRDREKDKSRKPRDAPTPPPVPPMPTVLPIADRFARSDAGTPLGMASGADANRTLGEGLIAPALGLAPSPTTPALSIGSSFAFVDASSPDRRSESPAELEESNNAALAPPPSMSTLRHTDSRLSLNYPQAKSGPDGKVAEPPMAHSLEIPRERNGDRNGRSGLLLQENLAAKASTLSLATDLPKAGDKKEKVDREKKIRKGLGIFAATGAFFGQNKPPPAPASAPAISAPNAHLFGVESPTDTKAIVDALNAKRGGSVGSTGSPGSENVVRTGGTTSPSYFSSTTTTTVSSISTPAAGSSSEPDSYFPYSSPAAQNLQSSSSLVASPVGSQASTSKPRTAAESGTIASRRANAPSRGDPLPLVIDVSGEDSTPQKGSVTPTQSKEGTPTIELFPAEDNDEENGTAPPSPRASVYAYYHNMPPPSPPPSGPLPPPPPPGQSLSPSRAQRPSRSPSPLRALSPTASLGVRNSVLYRSASPNSLQAQANVRRGKQSPFPTRPVLPQQESRDLVERVERAKVMYANGMTVPDAEADWGDNEDWRDAEVEDAYVYADAGYEYDGRDETRTSAFIRAARARGEKRVYFVSPPQSADSEGVFFPEAPRSVDGEERERIRIELVPAIEEEDVDDADFVQADEALASLNQLRPRPRLQRPEEEGEGDAADQRSIASMSVYSRYSMLDEESSSQTREGFVKRVHEWEKEEVPDVPKVPDQFKQPTTTTNEAPVGKWKAQLKPTNSRFR